MGQGGGAESTTTLYREMLMEVTELTRKKCVPCREGVPPMEPAKAREYLAAIPGWELSENAGRISRQFSFATFPDAIAFVDRAAELAEDEGHHPDFEIHYSKVNVLVWTHKIGGLHENDFIMAAKINELAEG
jgi:4a-hydroxytetrahydrobiopterin dehydratase